MPSIILNFHGHDKWGKRGMAVVGQPTAFGYTVGWTLLATYAGRPDVWIYNYWAGLSQTSNNLMCDTLYNSVAEDLTNAQGTAFDDGQLSSPDIYITGYSAGGVSALMMADEYDSVSYLGIADPEFDPSWSTDLMSQSYNAGVKENWYQTLDNAPPPSSIHGPVNGFANTDITGMMDPSWFAASFHNQACRIGQKKIYGRIVALVGW